LHPPFADIETVKRAFFYVLILTTLAVIGALALVFFILPSMNWIATRKPGQLENAMASYITSNWIRRHAVEQPNSFRPTPENLKAGQKDFDGHCSGCHGLTGNGENRLEADFYPPVAKLTGDTPKWSDGELYFIIANGIRMTGMPGFGKRHDPKEIWGLNLMGAPSRAAKSVRKSSDRITHAHDDGTARKDDERGSS
jgi:mono/diheme cytochrome c family protein